MSIPTSFVVIKDDGFRGELRLTWLPEKYSIHDVALIGDLVHLLGTMAGPNFGPGEAEILRSQFEMTMRWSPSKIHAGLELGWTEAHAGAAAGGLR